jgi:plasmid maintenance system killer protein
VAGPEEVDETERPRTPRAAGARGATGAGKLDRLNRAREPRELADPPDNRLEALKGDYAGYFSIRINDQYRIVFRFERGDARDVQIVDYHWYERSINLPVASPLPPRRTSSATCGTPVGR